MRIVSVLLYILMYSSSKHWATLAQQRKAFVNPQSECRINCLNGGFCAYLVDDPSIHTCLCLLNVFYGDRCQYAVVETTTSSADITKRPLSNHSGRERSEMLYERYEQSSTPAHTGKFLDDETSKYDEMSKLSNTKVYQIKETKRITSTEEMKMDENDYTEGWDKVVGDDDDDDDDDDNHDRDEAEYLYDDRANDPFDSVRTDSSMQTVEWPEGSDDYHTVTGKKYPKRIYLNKKKTDQMMIKRMNKDKQMKNDGQRLTEWTSKDENFDSSQTMNELAENPDDGWMISKRRRVITSSANLITNKPLVSTLFLILILLPILR